MGAKIFLISHADCPKSWFAFSQFRHYSWGVRKFATVINKSERPWGNRERIRDYLLFSCCCVPNFLAESDSITPRDYNYLQRANWASFTGGLQGHLNMIDLSGNQGRELLQNYCITSRINRDRGILKLMWKSLEFRAAVNSSSARRIYHFRRTRFRIIKFTISIVDVSFFDSVLFGRWYTRVDKWPATGICPNAAAAFR